MSLANFIKPIVLKTILSSAVSATYAAINTDGLEQPCFMLKIVNNSTEAVTISYDGTNDHDYVPTITTATIQNSPSQPHNGGGLFKMGTAVYVKGTAGTGNVYLVGYYQG